MNLKSMGIIAVVCLIIFAVLLLFFKALPYLLLIGLAIWVISRGRGMFTKKRKDSYYQNGNNDNTYNNVEKVEINDIDTSEAIDVDFHEIDN